MLLRPSYGIISLDRDGELVREIARSSQRQPQHDFAADRATLRFEMSWEYIGVGLGVLAIGIALMVGVPPPWWPEMPRGFVRATVAVGVLASITGLYLLMLGLWPAFKERDKWPQIGMILFALGFFGCTVWYWNNKPPATTPTQKPASLPPMPSLLSLFMTDFTNKGSGGGMIFRKRLCGVDVCGRHQATVLL